MDYKRLNKFNQFNMRKLALDQHCLPITILNSNIRIIECVYYSPPMQGISIIYKTEKCNEYKELSYDNAPVTAK